jgi:tRNA pseudouridine55 synthase
MDGVLIIDKPPGLTSHDVVTRVRHILRERRVGHTGTLDPFATGVLVTLIGRATRLARFLSGLEKEYEAVIRLGYATDTGDITGKPVRKSEDDSVPEGESTGNREQRWTKEQIEAALKSLRGEIDQVPPMYSAKKQGGRRLYELARRGEEVERRPAKVCIYEFEAINLASKPMAELLKDNHDGTFDFEVRVSCSAGTYIRTLAEDFGKRLDVGAHLAELRRTRVGDFPVEDAKTLEQLKLHFAEESLGKILYPPDEALSRLPAIELSTDDARRVRNGVPVNVSQTTWSDGELVRIRDEQSNLIAVAEFNAAEGTLHASVVIASDNS